MLHRIACNCYNILAKGCNNGIFHCYACYNAMLQALQTPLVVCPLQPGNPRSDLQGRTNYFQLSFGQAKSKATLSWDKNLTSISHKYGNPLIVCVPCRSYSSFVFGVGSQANCHTVPPLTVQRLDDQTGGRQNILVGLFWPRDSFSLLWTSSFQTQVSSPRWKDGSGDGGGWRR